MYKQSGRKLLELPHARVTEWLNSFDAVLTNCDGVLWLNNNAIDGSVEAINQFQKIGKKVYFCTNNSTLTRKELHAKATAMGYQITENRIMSSAYAVASYLKKQNIKNGVYVIGMKAVAQELDNVGIEHNEIGPDIMTKTLKQYLDEMQPPSKPITAVIIAFDVHFSYPKILKSAEYLNDPNVLFLAPDVDQMYPTPLTPLPGSGCFVGAVEELVQRKPMVIGKPNRIFCECLISTGQIDPARTLMIGDLCNVDILFGYNCGFQTLLVGTGVHNNKDIIALHKQNDSELKKLIPDLYVPKLSDLNIFMEA